MVRCGEAAPPKVIAFTTPEHALTVLQREGDGGGSERGTANDLIGGLDAAVGLALERLESVREEQLIRADRMAAADVYFVQLREPTSGQTVEQ